MNKPAMGLWKCYIRWRHSKGYGVHSPFAYRFVTDVLRPGDYGYYAYWKAERQLKEPEGSDGRLIRNIRFLIRLSIFLDIKRIISVGEKTRSGEITATTLGLPFIYITTNQKFHFQEGDLLLATGNSADKELVSKAVAEGGVVLVSESRHILQTFREKPMKKGLLLADKNKALLIPRKEMEYLAYEINLTTR